MKPTEADVQYCIENRDWISGLLEKRGAWQVGDWYWQPEAPEEVYCCQMPEMFHPDDDADLVWLPSVGDVLGMLDLGNIEIWGPTRTQSGWVIVFDKVQGRQYEGRTYLIALLELLKVVEGSD